MPNWCGNTTIVSGPRKDVDAFMELAEKVPGEVNEELDTDKNPGILCMHNFFSIPKGYFKGDDRAYNDRGYSWENESFGCKWGACDPSKDIMKDTKKEKIVNYTYDTPWGPAEEFFEHVSKLYPTLNFKTEYEESGMGFAGRFEYKDGTCIDSEEWECNYEEPAEWGDEEDPAKITL